MRPFLRPALTLALLLPAGCIPGPRPDAPADRSSPRARMDAADDPLPPPDVPGAVTTVELPAAAGPAPFSVTRVTPAATESAARTYRVERGDTLRMIAEKTGAGSEAIAYENDLAPPFTIRVGQMLKIPAGRWHRVRAGETGIAIARAYGVEWARVVSVNHLAEPYILRTGQRLRLPSTAEVATMSVEDRAAAFRLDIGDLISGGEPALSASAQPIKPRPAPPGVKPKAPLPATTAVAAASPFNGRFDWPLVGPLLVSFGPQGGGRRSEGINIAAAADTPIRAAADGVVIYAGTDIAVYGGLILIRHSDRWTTAYGHAAELLVSRGQAVKRGQPIARAGESGSVESPQVHFEIRQGRKPIDPVTLLPRRG
ncbi:MAG: LysM peptidoglycan-binding domain-containing M23 family metallopeptidase [Sphingomonas sp.]